jgi:PIN domain nuclease of toxin-antitoxin system
MWFINGDKLLSVTAKDAIENKSNDSYVSIASLWEMAIKASLGKLKIVEPFNKLIADIEEKEFTILSVTFEHAEYVSRLEMIHRDPFDRMLIVQTKLDNMTIVSSETVFDKYGVKRIW